MRGWMEEGHSGQRLCRRVHHCTRKINKTKSRALSEKGVAENEALKSSPRTTEVAREDQADHRIANCSHHTVFQR